MQYSKRAILALALLSPAITSSMALPRVAGKDNNAVAVADASLVSRNFPGAMPVKLRGRHGGAGGAAEDSESNGLSGATG